MKISAGVDMKLEYTKLENVHYLGKVIYMHLLHVLSWLCCIFFYKALYKALL